MKSLADDRRKFQPKACKRAYRVIALRKNLPVERGKTRLFDDER